MKWQLGLFVALMTGALVAARGMAAEDDGKDPEGGAGKIIKLDKKELIKKIDPNDPNVKIKKVEKKKAEPKVSAEAKAELEKITAAYKKLGALEVAGTLKLEMTVQGKDRQQSAEIKGAFQAPNKFVHEVKEKDVQEGAASGDLRVGSTGTSVYVHRAAQNDYRTAEAPKERAASEKWPQPMRALLDMQNPGLMCAVVEDAGKYLMEDTTEVTGTVNADIDGKLHVGLDFKGEKAGYRVLVDPETHLVRRLVLDLRSSLQDNARDVITKYTLTFDYPKVKADGTLKEGVFAWSAPKDAKEVTGAVAMDDDDAHGGGGEATALVGKAAPEFTLKGMDGKNVSLSDHKGSVVILDFWATWCGPCKVSLPGLNKVYNDLKGKGLVVYAVDLQEARDKVNAVAQQLKLDIPVLLDEKGEVAEQFGVDGIPHTVVIGKDGKVRKVFVGAGKEAAIRAAAEAALDGK